VILVMYLSWKLIDLLYLSTSLLWWQVVADIIEIKSSNTLRKNARCTWRPRESARNGDNTAIRHALSPLRRIGKINAILLPRRGKAVRPSYFLSTQR